MPNHHQLAILQEKLNKLQQQKFKTPKHNSMIHVELDRGIKRIKREIDELGKKGELKLVVCVLQTTKMVWDKEDTDEGADIPVKIPKNFNTTLTYMFMDLDDESIYVLLDNYLKMDQRYLSKSIVQVPLGAPIPSSLENNKISWSISSDI